jgi:hypothetical protein
VQALVFEEGAHKATKQNLEYFRCAHTYTLNAHATKTQTFKTTLDQKQAALTAELTAHAVTKAKLAEKEVQYAKLLNVYKGQKRGERNFGGMKAGYGSL